MLPIILSISNEEERAFVADLYIRYKSKIYNLAYQILHHKEDAEDCVHSVVKNIIDNLDRYQTSDLNAQVNLLVVSTRNAAIDIYRKNKLKRKYEIMPQYRTDDDMTENVGVEGLSDDADMVESILITEENKKRISEMIDELNYIYRDVLVLRYKFFMSNQEIAHFLKISEGSVKTRLHRARQFLLQRRGKELNEIKKIR